MPARNIPVKFQKIRRCGGDHSGAETIGMGGRSVLLSPERGGDDTGVDEIKDADTDEEHLLLALQGEAVAQQHSAQQGKACHAEPGGAGRVVVACHGATPFCVTW